MRHVLATAVLCWAVGCGTASEAPAPEASGTQQQPVADVSGEDVMADAPWRVQDSNSVIPIVVYVGDASKSGLLFRAFHLNTVEIAFLDGLSWASIYSRDFDGYDLAAAAATDRLWVLHVRRGRGGIMDGKPITAANLLGHDAAGQDLRFRVKVNATGASMGPDYTIELRVHVGEEHLPHGRGLFTGWYAGDTHVHTMYTHNWVEFGLPHRCILDASDAMGLNWILTTDHSCDLDPSCNSGLGTDDISTRVERWTFCDGDEPLPCTVRDHSGFANGYAMAENDAADAETWASWSSFKFSTGEEVNALSAAGRVVHTLAYRSGYIDSPGSGNGLDCDAVTLTMAGMLSQMPSGGFAFAAHPSQPLSRGINGGAWELQDIGGARSSPAFAGLQLWNTRKTRQTSAVNRPGNGGLDPFTSYPLIGDPCQSSDPECHPYYLEQTAVPLWDGWLSTTCSTGGAIFGLAGSDAHGAFNYTAESTDGLSLNLATDSALGKVRTVALSPSGDMSDILQAVQKGRTIMTDGPMMTFGIDRTGDGTIDQIDGDVQVGAQVTALPGSPVVFQFKWQSTREFGSLATAWLVRGDETTRSAPLKYELFTDGQNLGTCTAASRTTGACTLEVDHSASLGLPASGGTAYYRVEAQTANGTYRVLTNPIWITSAHCNDGDLDGYYTGPDCELFPDIAAAKLDCDDADATRHPGVAEVCNGVDDNCNGEKDEGLGPVTCGKGPCQITVPSCVDGVPRTCVPTGTCPAPDGCHLAGTCSAATGTCDTFPEAPDGTHCAASGLCTRGDTCKAGVCGRPVVCAAMDQCHRAGTCEPGTGLCTNPSQPDGQPCDDGDPQTSNDRCVGGACVGEAGDPTKQCEGKAGDTACAGGSCENGSCVAKPASRASCGYASDPGDSPVTTLLLTLGGMALSHRRRGLGRCLVAMSRREG
jgi:hypothetical protein